MPVLVLNIRNKQIYIIRKDRHWDVLRQLKYLLRISALEARRETCHNVEWKAAKWLTRSSLFLFVPSAIFWFSRENTWGNPVYGHIANTKILFWDSLIFKRKSNSQKLKEQAKIRKRISHSNIFPFICNSCHIIMIKWV